MGAGVGFRRDVSPDVTPAGPRPRPAFMSIHSLLIIAPVAQRSASGSASIVLMGSFYRLPVGVIALPFDEHVNRFPCVGAAPGATAQD
jgi:hypothetical protein